MMKIIRTFIILRLYIYFQTLPTLNQYDPHEILLKKCFA